ncbi:MAG: Rpn family recombination-promoting nuclease/putative transposase, partial [Bacteroidales bacterium]|nr:Rpn family recombination-promoting nuclease/putative transposase [Bacteroidales bacterium]
MEKSDNVIRFDWAAKNIFRDKADFSILEGLVSAILGEKVTITELLESESNQRFKNDKFNRVDIKAKDSLGEIILVEIQQSDDLNFLKRILYSTAKNITEHITSGKDYENVKKVFSINILYFNLGMGDDYLYHGQSELTGVHTGDRLVLGNSNFPQGLRMEAMNNIFPEYYVLRVSQFDETIEPASDLDEWMRYLKVGYIDPDTKVPGLQKAMERLTILNMSYEERKIYEDYRFERHYDENMLKAARYV